MYFIAQKKHRVFPVLIMIMLAMLLHLQRGW